MPAEDICTKQTRDKINILLFARCIFPLICGISKVLSADIYYISVVDLCVHNIACYFMIILQLSLFPFA